MERFTHEALGGAPGEGRVISEHSLGSLLLDPADSGGLLSQDLVQVFHDLQLMPPFILLPGEVSSALGGSLWRWGAGCCRSAWGLGPVFAFIPPAFDDHPLGLTKVTESQ